MKFRHAVAGGDEKVESQMVPMIDIVFQLLIFFVLTFNPTVQEGEFPITMPKQVPSSGMPDDVLSFIHIHLQAGADGNLVNILVNREESFGTDFARLRDYVIGRIKEGAVVEGAGSFAEEGEVEFEADYNLKYKNIILAVTAVTGYKDEEGHVIKLMQKIKFVPQKKPPAEKKADE